MAYLGDSGGGDTTTTQKWEPPDFIKSYLDQFTPQIVDTAAQYAKNYPVYTGERVAGETGAQETARQGLGNWISQNPFQQWTATEIGNTLAGNNATEAQMNPYENAINPYMGMSPEFQNVLKNANDAITGAWQTGTMNPIRAQLTQQGVYGGGGGNVAMDLANQSLAKQLAANTSSMTNQQWQYSGGLAENQIGRAADMRQKYLDTQNANLEAERQRQVAEAAMLPALNQSNTQMYQALSDMGGDQRAILQQQKDAQMQQWIEENFGGAYGNEMLMNTLRGMGGLGGTSTMQSTGGGSSPWGTIGGMGLLLGGLLGGGK